jgi:RNA polymerase sigma-70 factor (ECF subfamily)
MGHKPAAEATDQDETGRREWVLAALDQFEGRLLRYAQRLLGNIDESRDVVQFVFLRLCDQSPDKIGDRLAQDDRLAQWLYTVCRNRAMDVVRASGREKANGNVSCAVPTRDVEGGGHSPPYGRESDPADSAEEAELHGLLKLLVAALPASQREAIDLWSDGFSYQQIAEITNQKEGTIRVLVHRGLKAIREHPQVRALMTDEPAAQRRNGVAVGESPREIELNKNVPSPERAT